MKSAATRRDFLAWLGLLGPPPWIAVAVCIVVAIAVYRWV